MTAYLNARKAQLNLPRYLQPDFGDAYIRLDHDGTIKSGTLEALVERLAVDQLRT